MLNFVPNVRSSNIVVESFRIIFDNDLALTFTLIFSFDEFFLDIFIAKRFHKGAELFLLIISGRSS
jgi:hypothetical protein